MAETRERAGGNEAPPGAEPVGITGSGGPYAPDADTPLDTDDTRGRHFNQIARRAWVISLSATGVIAAFVIGATQADASFGALGALGVLLIVAAIIFAIASSRAEEDFFRAYAAGRNLRRQRKGRLPPNTPLLRKGDKRYAEQIMNGTLPGGYPGAIALYTYEETGTDSDGNRDTEYYRFTVAMHDIPPVAHKVGELYCERRSGFRFLDSAEDIFRRMKRLELESEALDRRYEIFYGAGDSENWMKQLFSPSFIVWLAEEAPDELAFELSGGSLCVNVKGHHDSADELDELCYAAAVVAKRLADEAAE
jgi:hypothetical protein